MENDKIISLKNLFQHLLSAEIYLSEKFPNQWKEQTNSKVPSNILPLYKASS